MVFLYCMNAVIANEDVPDIRAESRQVIRRQIEEWFRWMDHVLDVHRSNFVFRQPSPIQLEEHKRLLKECIRNSQFFNLLIADPDCNVPDLTARLQVRIRQLQDAYDTFHDTALTDDQAEKILEQVFPE